MCSVAAREQKSQEGKIPIKIPGVGTLMADPGWVAKQQEANHITVGIAVDIPGIKLVPSNWLTVTQAAEKYVAYFNLASRDNPIKRAISHPKWTISRACNLGNIRCLGVGRSRRIDPALFEAWLYRESVRRNSREDDNDLDYP